MINTRDNFMNKLWNSARFIIMNLEKGLPNNDLSEQKLDSTDRWILSKLNSVSLSKSLIVFVSLCSIPSTIEFNVNTIFVPVSPSGTGKTLILFR